MSPYLGVVSVAVNTGGQERPYCKDYNMSVNDSVTPSMLGVTHYTVMYTHFSCKG